MRVFLLFGCLVICVNGHIEIQVVQNVCMGGKCDSGENGNETPAPVTTTASLTQLNAELAQLMQQDAQAEASSNAVQSAADAASSMVGSASPSSLTGRRHRRNVIDLPPCGTGGSLVGDGATVVTAILNGIMGELSTISTTLDPTVLNCYASRALNVTSAFNDGLLPKIADMTAIIALAASVNSSVATASNALAAKINELQIQIKAKQDEIAAAQPTTGVPAGNDCIDGTSWSDDCNTCFCENGTAACTLMFCPEPLPAVCDENNVLLSSNCCYCFEGHVECDNNCLLETNSANETCDANNVLMSSPCCFCNEGHVECDNACLLQLPSGNTACDTNNTLLSNPCCYCFEGHVDCDKQCLLQSISANGTDSSTAVAT